MGINANQGVNISVMQNVQENSGALNKQKAQQKKDHISVSHDNVAQVVSEDKGEEGVGMKMITNLFKKVSDADVGKMNKTLQKQAMQSFSNDLDMLSGRDQSEDSSVISNSSTENLSNDKNLKLLKKSVLSKNKFFTQLGDKQKAAMEDFVETFEGTALEQQDSNPTVRQRARNRMQQKQQMLEKEGMDSDGVKSFKEDVKEASQHQGAEKQKKLKDMYKKGRQYFSSKLTRKQKELLEDFMDAYPQMLLEQEENNKTNGRSKEAKERMDQLEKNLQKSGLSKDEISRIKANIKNGGAQVQGSEKQKRSVFKNNTFLNKNLSSKQNAMVREYTSLLPKLFTAMEKGMSDSSYQVLAKKVTDLETKLRREGMTSQQLHDLKMQIKTSIRGKLVSQLKDSAIARMFAENQGDNVADQLNLSSSKRRENFLMNFMYGQHRLGGEDFGNYQNGRRGMYQHLAITAREEMRSFVFDELMNSLIRQKANPDLSKAEQANIDKLFYLANRSDAAVYNTTYSMHDILDDLGFVDFTIEDFESDMGGDQEQKEKQPDYGEYGFGEDDERELLINRYKSLLMQRAINPSARTFVGTQFKLMSTKKGLIALGVFTEELEEQLGEDAKKLAIEKLLEMLKESLMERATYYKLEGSAYKLNEKKIKSVLKNIQKLDAALSEEEFVKLKDQANKRMFDITNRELQMVNLAYENNRHPFYAQKKSSLIVLLERLKAESSIPNVISYDNTMLAEMKYQDNTGDGGAFVQYIQDDINIKLNEVKFLLGHKDFYESLIEPFAKHLSNLSDLDTESLYEDLLQVNEVLIDEALIVSEDLKSWVKNMVGLIKFFKKSCKNVNIEEISRIEATLKAIYNK